MPALATLKKRGLIVAAITAGGVLVTVLVQNALHAVVSIVAQGGFGFSGVVLGSIVGAAWNSALLALLPLSIGVFLSLWLLAPIGAELRFGHVVARAVLATAIGAAVAFIIGSIVAIVQTVVDVASALATDGTNSLSGMSSIGAQVLAVFGDAAHVFISSVPLVVLAAVFLWMWLRAHERDYAVEGMLDL